MGAVSLSREKTAMPQGKHELKKLFTTPAMYAARRCPSVCFTTRASGVP